MITMFDAIDWQQIPDGAEMVAGYVSGKYTWPKEAWEKFANRKSLQIAINATYNIGNCLVVLPGYAVALDVPDWIIKADARMVVPVVYTTKDRVQLVDAACKLRNVVPPFYWVRQLNDVAELPSGVIAKQYRATQNYGVSVIKENVPGVTK